MIYKTEIIKEIFSKLQYMNLNFKTLKVGDTVIVCDRKPLSTYSHYSRELGTVTRILKTQIHVSIV